MKKRFCLVLLSFLLIQDAFPLCAADASAPETERTERLAQLCKVWGTVRYLHPYLAYKDIDWDADLVKALPKVMAAKNTEEYAAAVQVMLDALDDPATRVIRRPRPAASGDGKPGEKKLSAWLGDGILAIDLSGPAGVDRLLYRTEDQAALAKEMAKAKGVVLDLRDAELGWLSVVSELLPPSRELRTPAHRYLVHSGYKPEGRGSSGYHSAFETRFGETVPPAPGGKVRPLAFIVSEGTVLSPRALALQQAGEAFLVAQGKLGEGFGSLWQSVPRAGGIEARVRVSELIGPDGGLVTVRADAEVAADADPGPKGPAFREALALVRDPDRTRKPVPKAGPAAPPPQAVWRPEKRYEDTAYPDREHRLLALFRLWNVIHYFYPYKHLMDQDWDQVLTRFIPRFEAARDAREYALAVAEMTACVQDGHTFVPRSAELRRYFGEFPPPIRLRLVEGLPVVTDILDEREAKKAGVAVGDVVLKVDGEPAGERMERYGKYVAASTPAGHKRYILALLLNGPDKSVLKMTVRGRDGEAREVELPRGRAYAQPGAERGGEAFKVLADNMGYVHLGRLTRGEVDPMFKKLKDTKAIIFDLRTYPQGTGPLLAARLNVKGARYKAAFQRNRVSPLVLPLVQGEQSLSFLQPIPPTDKPKYKGKTVTLIDERTQSQGEHVGLALDAACGTTFIGSQTAGANGDITSFYLPSGIAVTFSGHDVRHADGRQLQRVGLLPHIEVKPTIKGIREGKDEVLERALQYLREGK
jgi:C-terminal processing protease CtpA/Prc